MKKTAVLCVIAMLVVALAGPLSGCRTQPAAPVEPSTTTPEVPSVAPEVVACFNQLHDEAMQQIDAEIADLDSRMAAVVEKKQNLQRLKDRIDNTVARVDEEVAQEELGTGYWWVIDLSEEEFDSYENDYYKLVELDVRWDARPAEGYWEMTKSIRVEDKETGATGVPEVLLGELEAYQEELSDNKAAEQELQEEAAGVLADVVSHEGDWETEEISEGVYKVSGYGLGYTGQLSLGEWYYYEESDSIEPKSQAAIGLRDALMGE
jgi:hypothetical protein